METMECEALVVVGEGKMKVVVDSHCKGYHGLSLLVFVFSDVNNLPYQAAERIIHLLDVIISVDEQTLIDSNIIGNATNRIFKAIDKMGDYILMQNSSKAFFFSPSVAMVIWDLNAEVDNISVGLELTVDKNQSENELKYDVITLYQSENISYSCMDAAIYLPEEFIRHAKREQSDRRVRLTFSVFISNALFRNGQLENSSGESAVNMSLNGKVVAARLSVDGDAVTNLTGGAVTTVFSPITALYGRASANKMICVYWDFSASSGRGAWSSEGCRQAQYQEDCHVCECSHLTNFAVLMNVYGQDGAAASHDRPLSVITVVGLSLSIAGLFATMMSFLCIGKLRKLKPQQILFNMALSMLVSWVVFLAGFTRTGDYWLCLGVPIFLHYFILASFMWMLMEGLLQYLMLVKVLHVIGNHFILKAALTAWGIPLLPVGILLAIDPSQYRGGDTYCWMQLTSFYFSFLLPVTAVILINIVVYVLVITSLCCRQNVGFNKSNLKGVGVRSSVACFIVLGLSWSFAFFAIGEARIVFQYLFTVTCASQGFIVFLMFTARDPTVRSYWLNVLCCCLQRRKAQRGDPSSKRHRASKHDKEQSGLSSNVTMTTRTASHLPGVGLSWTAWGNLSVHLHYPCMQNA